MEKNKQSQAYDGVHFRITWLGAVDWRRRHVFNRWITILDDIIAGLVGARKLPMRRIRYNVTVSWLRLCKISADNSPLNRPGCI